MMKESIKIKRDRKLNRFVIKSLIKRPLSADQILDKIKLSKKFKINTLPGLEKYHLAYLEKKNVILRLDRKAKNFINNLSVEDFMEKTWFRWERSIKKNKWGSKSNNPYHSYYFATPITAKWTNIFNKIIRERILVKLSEFITDRDEIELCLNEIINTMKKIETLSRKKIKIYKRLQQETDDFLGVKGINYLESKIKKIKKFQKKDGMFLPFGFADYILSDFDSFMRPMDDIKFVLFSRLLNKLGTLHYLLNQRIKIISILDYEFKKENFVEPNEYLKNLTSS